MKRAYGEVDEEIPDEAWEHLTLCFLPTGGDRLRTAVRGTFFALVGTATLGYIAGGLWVLAVIW